MIQDRAPSATGEAEPVVCLGEAIVDVIASELPAEPDESAEGGAPGERLGGSIANVAVGARRFGAETSLLGGAGADRRGRFLRDALEREGVDVSDFGLVEGVATSTAIVTLDSAGEPSYEFRGEPVEPLLRAGERLDSALAAGPGLLVLGSDTLVDEPVRELTRRAAALAAERGWRVLYDPNLRPNRWPDRETMHDVIGGLIASAHAVKLNRDEARELTGERDAARAVVALLERGPELAVVTCGADGIIGRWSGSEAVEAESLGPVRVLDATGAGDSVTSVLAAALALGAPRDALAAVLHAAGETARGVVGVIGALDGLPARGWPGWPER